MLIQDGILKGKHTLLLSSNTKPCLSLNSAVTAKFQLFILLFDIELALNITAQIVIGCFTSKKPFHDRELFEEGSSRPILPTECVLSNGNVIEKGKTNSLWVARNVMMNYVVLFLYITVPVPLYVPTDCTECSDKGKIELVSGPTCIAVVNQNGKIF